MQYVFGSAWGWRRAAAPPAPASSLQVPLTLQKIKVFNKSSSAIPPITNKKPPSNGGMPSLLRSVLQNQQAKFWQEKTLL